VITLVSYFKKINNSIKHKGCHMNKSEYIALSGIDVNVVDHYLVNKKWTIEQMLCGCGKPKRVLRSSQAVLGVKFDGYCGNKECNFLYGKKRPEHSKFMSALAASGQNAAFNATLMKKGKLHNKEVNTISFLRKKLKTVGYDEVATLNDNDVINLNSQYESKKQFNPRVIAKSIINFIKKHKLEDTFSKITYDEIVLLPTEELMQLRYKWKAWHHALYCSDVCGSKIFKRIDKTDLIFHKRGLDYVLTRSSYESNYIDFFEANKISWDYEPFRIVLENTTYKPDFIFTYNGKTYILETKGFLLEKNKKQYLSVKINGAFDYAKKNNYAGMIFTFDAKPKSIIELINQTMTEKF